MLESINFGMAEIERTVIFEGASARSGKEQFAYTAQRKFTYCPSHVCLEEAPSWYFSWKERLRFGRA